MNEFGLRAISGLGYFVLLGAAWLLSNNRGAINRRTVTSGVAIQLVLALALLASPLRELLFPVFEALVGGLIDWTQAGAGFLFGPLLDVGDNFALSALPIIIFMGSVFGILYHIGWIQPVVRALARVLSRSMSISGAEAFAAAANVFVGMTEAGFAIAPYLARMTRSELFSFMTVGMATIAGSVLVAYAKILGEASYAGHLIVASLISVPAALVVAKIMIPETGAPESLEGSVDFELDAEGTQALNVIDAATMGALTGLRLALNVGALLIAFVALVAFANSLIGGVGEWVGLEGLSLQKILGWAFSPVALVMGIPAGEAREVGALIGVKTVLNEFIAYQDLAAAVARGALSERSAIISSYALCGFANFGSLAIMLGGVDALAPERRPEAAELGIRSIVAGTIATCLTACIAGVIH